MVKGKVQMGTPAATHAQWYQDSLDDCSPEDRVWGWSIHASEILHHECTKIDDECLIKMLRQGLCDTKEGSPAWTEKLSIKEGIRLMSSISTRICQKFTCLDSKVGILDASSLMMLTGCPLDHVIGFYEHEHVGQ